MSLKRVHIATAFTAYPEVASQLSSGVKSCGVYRNQEPGELCLNERPRVTAEDLDPEGGLTFWIVFHHHTVQVSYEWH